MKRHIRAFVLMLTDAVVYSSVIGHILALIHLVSDADFVYSFWVTMAAGFLLHMLGDFVRLSYKENLDFVDKQ